LIDKTTKKWIRNAADERAARNGYFMDESRGDHFVEFVQTHLKFGCDTMKLEKEN
jgi:hypothetical protein